MKILLLFLLIGAIALVAHVGAKREPAAT